MKSPLTQSEIRKDLRMKGYCIFGGVRLKKVYANWTITNPWNDGDYCDEPIGHFSLFELNERYPMKLMKILSVALIALFAVNLSNAQLLSNETARLANISTRAYVGTGTNVMIAGFVVTGTGNELVLIRGIGPSLAQFGVTGVLPAPIITLYDSKGNRIAENIGWVQQFQMPPYLLTPRVDQAEAWVGAFPLAINVNGQQDSAMAVVLLPGSYTVVLSGGSNSNYDWEPCANTTGVALLEVYEINDYPVVIL